MNKLITNKELLRRPTGSFLKPEFQVTCECVHRSFFATIVVAESPEEAAEIARKVHEKGVVVYPSQQLGTPEGLIDSVGTTEMKDSKVISIQPALQEKQFDLSAFPAQRP